MMDCTASCRDGRFESHLNEKEVLRNGDTVRDKVNACILANLVALCVKIAPGGLDGAPM